MARKKTCTSCIKFRLDKDNPDWDGWCLFFAEERDRDEDICDAYTQWTYKHPREMAEERKCAVCGRKFMVQSKKSTKKYCSMRCKSKHYWSLKRRGEANGSV